MLVNGLNWLVCLYATRCTINHKRSASPPRDSTRKFFTCFVLTAFLPQTMKENTFRSKYKHITDVQITKCLTLNQFGLLQRAIASELGCNQSTVQWTLKHYDYKTFVEHQRPIGCPRKPLIADDRHIVITAKWNFNLPLCDITNLTGLLISQDTTCHRLNEVELVSRYQRRKPYLSAKHKSQYKDWTAEDRKKVIFSDECLLCVGVDPHW